MDLFTSWRCDRAAQAADHLASLDDEEGLRRADQGAQTANRTWDDWVQEVMGARISSGYAEGRCRVPADEAGDIPSVRARAGQAADTTCSVGVGLTIREADLALEAAEHRGGDQVVLFTPEVEREVRDQETKKSERPFRSAGFRHRQTGQVVPSGPYHDANQLPEGSSDSDWEDGFLDYQGAFLDRDEAAQRVREQDPDIKKAEPAGNVGPHAGFAGHARPGAPSKEQPVAEGSEHSQGEAARSWYAEHGDSPEGTSSAEDELHAHAQASARHDEAQQAAQSKLEATRQQVVGILQSVRQQGPKLDAIRQQDPELFGAMQNLVQALVQTSRALVGQDQPIQKAEPTLTQPPRPQLHSTVEGFMGGLKALPKGTPERGRFITQHMQHAPFLTALKAHPQGAQVHQMLTQHLNSAANAGFRPGATVATAKSEVSLHDHLFELGKRPFEAGQRVYQTSHTGEKFPFTIKSNQYKMLRYMDVHHPHVYIEPDGWEGSKGWYPLGALHFEDGTATAKSEDQGADLQKAAPKLRAPPAAFRSRDGITIPATGTPEREDWDARFHQALQQTFGHAGKLKPAVVPLEGLSMRNEAVNKDRYKLYRRMATADKLPPIVIRQNGTKFDVVDGNHRYQAARDAGLKSISAVVMPPHKKSEWDDRVDILASEDFQKAQLPMPESQPTKHVLHLPLHAVKGGKVKIQHGDGRQGWVSVRAGMVRSDDGHPISSRNARGK